MGLIICYCGGFCGCLFCLLFGGEARGEGWGIGVLVRYTGTLFVCYVYTPMTFKIRACADVIQRVS